MGAFEVMLADHEKRNTLLSLAAAATCIGGMCLEGFVFHASTPGIDPAQAKALIDDGALVIDVRSQEAFEVAHLPAAVHVPLRELAAGVPAEVAGAEGLPIVVYCNDGLTEGPAARALLVSHGFKKVAYLKGGIEGWPPQTLHAGPTARRRNVGSDAREVLPLAPKEREQSVLRKRPAPPGRIAPAV